MELQWFCSWGIGDRFGGVSWIDVEGKWQEAGKTGWCDWRQFPNNTFQKENTGEKLSFEDLSRSLESLSYSDANCGRNDMREELDCVSSTQVW